MTISHAREDRLFKILLAATVLCYAIGYPLALIDHSNAGWLFVLLGGPLLVAVLVLTIRRAQRRADSQEDVREHQSSD